MSRCALGQCDGSGWLTDEAARSAAPCACRPQLIERRRTTGLNAAIPKRYRNASLESSDLIDFDPKVVRAVGRYVRDIVVNLDRGRGLWLYGGPGTGKTTLAMVASKAAIDAGRTVAVYSLPRLLAEIRTTYDDDADRTYLDLIDRLTAVDLLHIDDLGAESSSPWVLEQLYAIVNARYEEERAIIVTTNLETSDELAEQIGRRTVSRLMEMCEVLPLLGSDIRAEHRHVA